MMKLHKVIKGLSSTIVNLMILGYIASWIFDIEIWILSDLSLIQFILVCIAIHIVATGLGKIFEPDKSYKHEQDQWQRWNNTSNNKEEGGDYYQRYGGNYAPPPPPPPNGSFSEYNPYEQNNSNVEDKQFYNEQAKGFKEQAKQYKEQTKEYKEQAKDYKEQAKQYKEHTKEYNDGSQYTEHTNHYNTEQKYYDSYSSGYDYNKDRTLYHNTFIGDFKFKESYTQLPPMEINAFIGDAHIDLTRVEIPYGETKLQMSCFIGDMKVHIPNDPRIGVKLSISAFIGDGKLFDEKRGGFGLGTSIETPHYNECDRKVEVVLNAFIGDVKIKRVG